MTHVDDTCPHKYLYISVSSSMSPNSQKVETPKCPVVGELIHTRERPSAMKRREALTLTTTWTDPEITVLSERSRHRGTHRV